MTELHGFVGSVGSVGSIGAVSAQLRPRRLDRGVTCTRAQVYMGRAWVNMGHTRVGSAHVRWRVGGLG
jgi:hypothetical protein